VGSPRGIPQNEPAGFPGPAVLWFRPAKTLKTPRQTMGRQKAPKKLGRKPLRIKSVAGFNTPVTRDKLWMFLDVNVKTIDSLTEAGVLKKPYLIGPSVVAY